MDFNWIFDILAFTAFEMPSWLSILFLPIIGYFCWHNIHDYDDFPDCVDAIGANEACIFITNQVDVTADITIPANITLRIIQGGTLNISAGKTVTINGHVDAGLYQIFEGLGTVTFGTYANTLEVHPEWWGAVANNVIDSTAAINAMVQSLPAANIIPKVIFQHGIYVIAGNPAITFDRALNIEGNGASFDYGAGVNTALLFNGATDTRCKDIRVIRTFDNEDDIALLLGTGIQVRNTARFEFYHPRVLGFATGMYFLGDQAGCSYGSIFTPEINRNKIGMYFNATLHADSYVTDIKTFGGFVRNDGGFSAWAASRNIEITNTNKVNHEINGIHFYGVDMEGINLAEKVRDNGIYSIYDGCYWDQSNAASDIYFTADSRYCAVRGGNNLHDQIIIDSGNYTQISGMDKFGYGKPTKLTVSAGGVITVTKSYHLIDGAGDANDDLDTINGGVDGMVLVLQAEDDAVTITIRDGVGNIETEGGASIVLDDVEDKAYLFYDATNSIWCEMSRFTG